MGVRDWNPADLAREAKVDPGTVLDFLNGVRVLQHKNRAKIEKAIGLPLQTLEEWAGGAEIVLPDSDPVGPAAQDDGYVEDRLPGDPEPSITDDEVVALIERQQRELAELLEKMRARSERPVDGPT